MKPIDREPIPFPRIPGTVSEDTLKAWMLNTRILGQSLQDAIPVFIPTYQAIRRDVLGEYIRDPQRAVDEGMAEIKLRPPKNDIPLFDKTRTEEMQRAGLWYMVNKLKIDKGEEILERTPSMYTSEIERFTAIKYGPRPDFAPVPHPLSVYMVMVCLQNPDFTFSEEIVEDFIQRSDSRTTLDAEMDIVAKNIDV